MDKPIRLIIADDHTVVRDGIAALLEDEPDLKVIGRASSGQEALALIRACQPDIALLDITMGDMTGLEAARQITAISLTVNIIILTMHQEEAFFFEALRSGAAGYVLKGSPTAELMLAIRAVYDGGVFLPPQLARGLVQDYVAHSPQPAFDDSLTSREREILALIAQGLSNRDIARRLTLSMNTIKTHRLHIYQKLNLSDRASLVNYALRQGLLNGASPVY
jgi:DNA-binding NarL/FixJ family response regulator